MILLSRAEGFGLPLLQALSSGLHVITTRYSAQAEFCTPENSRLVAIDALEDAYDGIFFFRQGRWAKLAEDQIDQAANFMRQIHQLKQAGELPLNVQGIETAEQLTWDRIAWQMTAAILD